MKLYAGTSGYSYKEWKGGFYPDDLPATGMLAYYAERLGAVEINNTFYRVPRANVVEAWAAQVPEDFRFVLKATRRITHRKRLEGVDEETEFMYGKFELLGERLGAVLFQLPPHARKDIERLRRFVELPPAGARIALEFRHESWLDEEVFDCLRARNCALVVTDGDAGEPPELPRTADWGYLRLRRSEYPEEELHAWWERVRTQDWGAAYVFFKHEDECGGPDLAARFQALAEG